MEGVYATTACSVEKAFSHICPSQSLQPLPSQPRCPLQQLLATVMVRCR